MWSAWTIPVPEKLVELLKLPSPVRWNVLFVEPCSAGQAPVASVDQPTPVFGGKPCFNPLLPLTPSLISCFIVGMKPWPAYLSTKSGRIPSEANSTALSVVVAGGELVDIVAPDAGPALPSATVAVTSKAAVVNANSDRDATGRRSIDGPLEVNRLLLRCADLADASGHRSGCLDGSRQTAEVGQAGKTERVTAHFAVLRAFAELADQLVGGCGEHLGMCVDVGRGGRRAHQRHVV